MEARYTVKNSSGTSGVQVQKYQVTFERVPTADISLKDAKGRALNLGFEPDITEYETDTVSSKVSVETKTYGTDGYSVTVKNGDTVSEDGNCNLSKGINSGYCDSCPHEWKIAYLSFQSKSGLKKYR